MHTTHATTHATPLTAPTPRHVRTPDARRPHRGIAVDNGRFFLTAIGRAQIPGRL